MNLDSKQLLQLTRLGRLLCIIVTTQVLSTDKGIGDSSLTTQLGKRCLNVSTVLHFIKFVNLCFYAQAFKETLCGSAKGTVRLGKDNDYRVVETKGCECQECTVQEASCTVVPRCLFCRTESGALSTAIQRSIKQEGN